MAETRSGELQCNALGQVTKDAEPAGRRQEGYYASRNGQTQKNDKWQCYERDVSKCVVDEKQRGKPRFL